MNIIEDIKNSLRKGDGLTRLLAVNIVIFIVIQLVYIGSALVLNDSFVKAHPDLYLAASSSWEVMLHRPWSIITHMFTHEAFGHFLFNIFVLYTGGKLFRTFFTSSQLVVNYILGGLSGYLMFFLFFNIFPAFRSESYVLGASAAVMSIIFTVGITKPHFVVRLFGVFEMKLIWLCGLLVVVDLIGIRKGFNSGGHIGHLGGALFGAFYGYQYRNGKVMGNGLNRFLDRLKNVFSGRKSHLKTVHHRPISDEEFNAEKTKRQKRVDEILDKINRSGYESLSKDEKDFLFKYSQK
ncbi:MAG: rhomboid family intramembrane serine protease [Flavobacteriales bacterium]